MDFTEGDEATPDARPEDIAVSHTRRLRVNDPFARPIITGMSFDALTDDEKQSYAIAAIDTPTLYQDCLQTPASGGVLDTKLGAMMQVSACGACDDNDYNCIGHSGVIRLSEPLFNSLFRDHLLKIVRCVCPHCSAVKLPVDRQRALVKEILSRQACTLHDVKARLSRLVALCKKAEYCYACGQYCGYAIQFVDEKTCLRFQRKRPLDIVSEQWQWAPQAITATSELVDAEEPARKRSRAMESSNLPARSITASPDSPVSGDQSPDALVSNRRMDGVDLIFMYPAQVAALLDGLGSAARKMLAIGDGDASRIFIVRSLLMPPSCTRPIAIVDETGADGARRTHRHQDITFAYHELLFRNMSLHDARTPPYGAAWKLKLIDLAMAVDAVSGKTTASEAQSKWSRKSAQSFKGFAAKLPGKGGRFRKDLLGKRVNHSGRTVISPDPNIDIDQIGIPRAIARQFDVFHPVNDRSDSRSPSFRQIVSRYGKAMLRINKSGRHHKVLLSEDMEADEQCFTFGMSLIRGLMPTDIVLANRQPSLHKQNIMAFRVLLHDDRTIKLHLANCPAFNADFDGDEMNIHMPNFRYEARGAAEALMRPSSNLTATKNGEVLICLTQVMLSSEIPV